MSVATASFLHEDLVSCQKKAKMDTVDDSAMEFEQRLMVKKLSNQATIPTRGSTQAAGYDLYR